MIPILKWVGGKTKLLPEIKRHLPRRFGRYLEPFFGGGALFFDLEPSDAIVSDVNAALVGVYQQIAHHIEAVVTAFEPFRLPEMNNEARYYEVRNAFNARMRAIFGPVDAAAFMFLNRACYNGLWRENKGGNFNVPFGKYQHIALPDADRLRTASQLLKRNAIGCCSYEVTAQQARAGDLVYFDPPYDPLNETSSFTAYTGDGFGKSQQRRLVEVVHELRNRGCYVIASNSDTTFTRGIYSDFEIHRVARPGNINSEGTKRGPVSELLVVARPNREILHEMFDTSEVTV